MESINLIIGGDVFPHGKNLKHFIKGDSKKIFNDLLEEFRQADLLVINLECPLIDYSQPIIKAGPILDAPSISIKGIIDAGIDIINLANNHIFDHGEYGLENTINTCSNAQIPTVGAGRNIEEARKALIITIKEVRIGLLAFAEHEFSVANKKSGGANPLNLTNVTADIIKNRQILDYLIILVHGGNENYPYPSPRLKEICHYMVDLGANAVIVQHSHCSGCYEEYRSSHIVYGQGNLIFDWPNQAGSFYEGFLVKLSTDDKFYFKMDLIPYTQSFYQVGTRKLIGKKKDMFLNLIDKRSRAIKDDSFVYEKWLEFCKKKKHEYINRIYGHNKILAKLNFYQQFVKYFYSKKSVLRLKNTISCEAHREVIETILSQEIKKYNNNIAK
jgi:poly-gamma-glutamate synthesis protein (capsule biosynthesis protein)